MRPQEKAYKRFDARGLFLLVTPTGGRLWRYKYRIGGREKLLALGAYPDVSLKQARDRCDAARKLVADGIDPSARRQAEKAAIADTFEAIAREWLGLLATKLEPATIQRTRDRLEAWVFGGIGRMPVDQIKAVDVLKLLRRIEARGRHETAHRARADCSRVFRHAVATGRAERDPTVDLKGALAPVKTTHFAAITEPGQVGALLRAIDGYRGQPSTEIALKLAPLVFVRPGELRAGEWSEISLEGKFPEWRIPAARMKMREPHLVPLSRQAVALLRELEPLTGGGRFLFPTLQDPGRPMSNNTLNTALRRLGYTAEQMTSHGFRSMASTLLNEQGWHPDLIELQLAHKDCNELRAIYNRATRLPERRKVMQVWADYLDGLRGRECRDITPEASVNARKKSTRKTPNGQRTPQQQQVVRDELAKIDHALRYHEELDQSDRLLLMRVLGELLDGRDPRIELGIPPKRGARPMKRG